MARVLIVEDNDLLAAGLHLMLEDAGHTVVGIAATENAAVAAALETRPELVISNIRLRTGDAISAARRYVPAVGCILILLVDGATTLPPASTPPCIYTNRPAPMAALLDVLAAAVRWRDGMAPDALPVGFQMIP